MQVAVYVRHSLLCLRAEEGITGCLKSPLGAAFKDLPDSDRIGGYPTSLSTAEALELDSEGRTVIVELEWTVFIGVYCPAVTMAGRNEFRVKFLALLEERVRNLLALGKSVIVAGDINICRAPIDTADPVGAARRTESGTFEDTESRRWLDRMLHPTGPLVDTGRHFHSDRKGMYTCTIDYILIWLTITGWEQRIQARAGNYGKSLFWTALINRSKN
jgi:AP endonuclease-2